MMDIGAIVAVLLFATGNFWLGVLVVVATLLAGMLWAVLGPIPD